jgi:hypothetical protein
LCLVWECLQLLLKRYALQESDAAVIIGVVGILLQDSGIAIVVRAAEKDLAAVDIVDVQFECFYESGVSLVGCRGGEIVLVR